MPQPIRRLDDLGNRLQVVFPNEYELLDYRSKNILTEEHPDFFISVPSPDTARIGTATHPDGTSDYRIHGANGVYAETSVTERELTAAERDWCADTVMYSGDDRPTSVFEFTIPHPDDLREAILNQDLTAFSELDTLIQPSESRHQILTDLQASLEEESLRATKLCSYKGNPNALDPEWNPETTDTDRETLANMASLRHDSHLTDFTTVAGFEYHAFFVARRRALGVHEPYLDDFDLVALSVAGVDDWSYCRSCGAVAPQEQFLHIRRKGRSEDDTFRVCENCAEQNSRNLFTDEAVAKARDQRANEFGGQRTIHGEY